MNRKSPRPLTRMFPIGSAAHNARWIATFLAGTSMLSSSALAINNFWLGGSSDWETPGNWSLGRVPVNPNGNVAPAQTYDDAVVDLKTPAFPVLTASPSVTPRDVRVGSAAGSDGRLDQRAGVVSSGTGNWIFVGVAGGTGEYNLANTAAVGGTFTGFGLGSGSMNAGGTSGTGGRLYVGGDDGGGDAGNGIFRVNTSGTVTVRNDFLIGTQTGTGTFLMDHGTMTTGGWNFCGEGTGSTGTFRMSGGTLTNAGRYYFGNGGTATVEIAGGTVTNGSEVWVGNAATGLADFKMSAGNFSAANWIAVGRDSGKGTLTLTGGTITKTGAGSFTIGTLGTDANGLVDVSGGLIDIQSGNFYVGEGGTNTIATLNLSGTGEIRVPLFILGNGGSATGTANLNGGTLRTGQIDGGSAIANVHFNGTQIVVTSVQPTLISDLDLAEIGTGGLKVDTNGNNAGSTQSFSGTGGVTKSGAGTLSLTGSNNFSGPSTVSGGKLILTPDTTGGGNLTVADNAALGINVPIFESQLNVANATFGTAGATSLDINYGNILGNPSSAPLNVTGNLALNGTATVNLSNSFPSVGSFPLVKYNTKSGGNFVLGTLPNGVQATLVHDTVNKIYRLNITSVALPRWSGAITNKWDINTTQNWMDMISSAASRFLNGNPVLFDDNSSVGNVELDTVVTPGGITVNNDFTEYSITSPANSGRISGTNGLLKQGIGGLTIDLVNDYTGVTTVQGGTLTVNALGNGGTAGPLGAAGSNPANLVLAGGTLNYTGPSTTTDRGFTVGSGDNTVTSGLVIANDLTVSGPVVSGFGKLSKRGPGVLTLTNPVNVLANGSNAVPGAVRIDEGGLVLDGGGTQVNTVTGEFWIGSTTDAPASLTLNATTLNTNTWLSVGRGNGTIGLISTLTATNSTLTTGSISLGYAAGVGGHQATSSALFTNSTFTTGVANIGESGGSTATFTLAGASTATTGDLNVGVNNAAVATVTVGGTSVFNTGNRVFLGNNNGGTGSLVIEDNGVFNRTGGWMSIGGSGTGVLTVRGNGVINNTTGDFNVSDVAGSKGTLELAGAGVINAGVTYFGKATTTEATVNISGGTFNGTSAYMAQTAGSVAEINLTGGVLNLGANNEIFIGESGTLAWQQSAGTFNATGWTVLGRRPGGVGTVNVSGGTFSHVMAARHIIVGEEGTGELTISGTGVVSSDGNSGLVIGNAATGVGTVNLDGGTLTVKAIHEGAAGTSAFNFNGGLLKAAPGAAAVFLTNVDTVTVETNGARMDTNGQDISFDVPLQNGGGGLTKSGAGRLSLNGFSTYTGATAVSAGSLGGTGSVAGPLTVAAGAEISPGPAGAAGSFSTGAATLSGSYACEIDGVDADQLVVNGALNVSAATLNISTLAGGATQPAYVIATYTGATPAPFAAVNGLPAGYSVNYAYNNGASSTNIALVSTVAPAAYTAWIATYFPGETNPAITAPSADPDKDGSSNLLEFALGGLPNSGSSNARIHSFAQDSDGDADTTAELLLTIAVRTGTPAFTGSPSPRASFDGITVGVEGGSLLSSFPTVVIPVGVVATGLPAAPVGYEYRTFSLSGSNGLTGKGFLRARVGF